MMKIKTAEDLQTIARQYTEKEKKFTRRIYVCGGGGCISSNCLKTRDAVVDSLKQKGLEDSVEVVFTGCIGMCAAGPVVVVEPEGTFYAKVNADMAREIIERHIVQARSWKSIRSMTASAGSISQKKDDIPFFTEQVQIALRNCGKVDFASLENYIAGMDSKRW